MGARLGYYALGTAILSLLFALAGSFVSNLERVPGFFFIATTLMTGCVAGILTFSRVMKMGLPFWVQKFFSSVISGVIAALVGVLMVNMIWHPLWHRYIYESMDPRSYVKGDMMLLFMGAAISCVTGFIFGSGVGQDRQEVVSSSSNETR
jgi:hypothetical protein